MFAFEHNFRPVIGADSYEPTPYQQRFHEADDKFRILAGELGTGKTTAGIIEALYQSYLYPDNYGVIFTPKDRIEAIRKIIGQLLPESMKADRNYPQYSDGVLQVKSRIPDKPSRIHFSAFTNYHFNILNCMLIGWFMLTHPHETTERFHDRIIDRLRRKPSDRKGWYIHNISNDLPDWLLETANG